MRRLAYLLVVLALVLEKPGENTYSGQWSTFLLAIGEVFFTSLPLVRLPLWDLLLGGLLIAAVAKPGALVRTARPLQQAMLVSVLAIAVTIAWGVLRGGSFYQSFFQLHALGQTFLLALLFIAVLRQPRAIQGLEKVLLWSALARTGLAFLFFFSQVYGKNPQPYPKCMTTHDDTVLFVLAIVIVVSRAIVRMNFRSWLQAAAVSLPVLYAIHINQRRLAWVSLAAALLALYTLLDPALRRRANRMALALAPVLFLYVTLGWGREGALFAPLRSLASMTGETEDDSSKSRNVENDGLVLTFAVHPVLGTGWGHEYLETSTLYSQGMETIFPQYRFLPHNSLLGAFAFTGVVGFTALWMVFSVTAFLATRTSRMARRPRDRICALWAVAGLPIYLNQCYADMGVQSLTGAVAVAASMVVAGRLSVGVGAWPGQRAARLRRTEGPPPPEGLAVPERAPLEHTR